MNALRSISLIREAASSIDHVMLLIIPLALHHIPNKQPTVPHIPSSPATQRIRTHTAQARGHKSGADRVDRKLVLGQLVPPVGGDHVDSGLAGSVRWEGKVRRLGPPSCGLARDLKVGRHGADGAQFGRDKDDAPGGGGEEQGHEGAREDVGRDDVGASLAQGGFAVCEFAVGNVDVE